MTEVVLYWNVGTIAAVVINTAVCIGLAMTKQKAI